MHPLLQIASALGAARQADGDGVQGGLMVVIDQGVQAPIFTVVILFFFAIVEGKGLGYAKNQVRDDLGDILIKNWSVFLPATVINLAFCPPNLRVLFLNCVFFGWVVYLSLFLNSSEEESA